MYVSETPRAEKACKNVMYGLARGVTAPDRGGEDAAGPAAQRPAFRSYSAAAI